MKVSEFVDFLNYDFENIPINDLEQIIPIITQLLKSNDQLKIRELMRIIKAFPTHVLTNEVPDDLIYDFLSKQTLRGPHYDWNKFAQQLNDAVLNEPQLKTLRKYIYRGVSCERLWQSDPRDKLTWAMDALDFLQEVTIIWRRDATIGHLNLVFNQEKIRICQSLARFSRVIRREIISHIPWHTTIYVSIKSPELLLEIKNQVLRSGAISDNFVLSLYDEDLQKLFFDKNIRITRR